jgi:hypothetical protein
MEKKMLLETIITITLSSLLITTLSLLGISYTQKLTHHHHGITLYNQLHNIRMEAIATDTEKVITNQTIGFEGCAFSQNKLGFTDQGNTKYAGSISFTNNALVTSLSLVVGYGHITLKPPR